MEVYEQLGVWPDISQRLAAQGYEKLSQFQQACIPRLLNGLRDFMAVGASGSGKTLAHSIGISQLVDTDTDRIKAVVLGPNKEFCQEAYSLLKACRPEETGMRVGALFGGLTIEDMQSKLEDHPQVVVTTPERLLYLVFRQGLDLSEVHLMVIDEFESLSHEQRGDLEAILKNTPAEKRTWVFSQDKDPAIKAFIKTHLNEPYILS